MAVRFSNIILGLLTLVATELYASDIEKLGYEINGEKYIPVTFDELSDAKSFWSSKASKFYKKNVVLLVTTVNCNPFKYADIEDTDYEHLEARVGWKSIFIRPPEGSILGGWKAYFTDELLSKDYTEEIETCTEKQNSLVISTGSTPQHYVWGTVMQGQHKGGRYSEEWFDLHGLTYADGFGDNVFVPSLATIAKIATAVARANRR